MTYTSPHSGVMLCPCSYLWSTACASCSTCSVHHDAFRKDFNSLVLANDCPLVQSGGEETPTHSPIGIAALILTLSIIAPAKVRSCCCHGMHHCNRRLRLLASHVAISALF